MGKVEVELEVRICKVREARSDITKYTKKHACGSDTQNMKCLQKEKREGNVNITKINLIKEELKVKTIKRGDTIKRGRITKKLPRIASSREFFPPVLLEVSVSAEC